MLQSVNSIRAIQAKDSMITPASLPLDIWIEVALTLAAEDDYFVNVIPLLAVCKLLRSALHQVHQLWTSLDFNYRDDPSARKFPVPKYESIRLFLDSLPANSVQRIRWRPSLKEDMTQIILYTLLKFDAIEVLDVRPHIGDSTSKYLLAAYMAISSLHGMNIRRNKFRALMIANTSFRQEIIQDEHDISIMEKLQQELECLADVQYDKGRLPFGEIVDKIVAHDLAICDMCESQFAHTSGNKTCIMEGCANRKFNVCLSCTEYCSACDTQICPNHPDDFDEIAEDYFLEGRCYHGDGEMLRYCSQHEDTNLCCKCQLAQCEHHLQTCVNREGDGPCRSGSITCIDCCVQCPVCSCWYCEDCYVSEEHEKVHSNNGYPELTYLFEE